MSPSDFHDSPLPALSGLPVGSRDPPLPWISHVASKTLCACGPHYPGWRGRILRSVAPPSPSGLPLLTGGSAPARNYRGLLRVHLRYGLRACTLVAPRTSPEASAGRLLASTAPVATEVYRQLPGRDFHPLAFETQEAYTCLFQLTANLLS
jgi:hypothetical protein